MKNLFVILCFAFLLGTGMYAQQRVLVQSSAYAQYQVGAQSIGPDFGNNPAAENFYSYMRDRFGDMGVDEKLDLDDIDGSIYINEKFVPGIIYHDGDKESRMYVRYNAFNDEFEIKEYEFQEKVLALLKDPEISCYVAGNEYVYTDYLDNKKENAYGYLKMVYSNGPYKLFEQTRKLFKEGKKAKTSLGTSFPHRFVDEVNYYIEVDNGKPQLVPSRKKEMVELFLAKDQKKVKQFIKEKGIDVKDKNGLVNILAYAGNL